MAAAIECGLTAEFGKPALEAWLAQNRATLKPDDHVVDIGFTPREGVLEGGTAISPEMMRTMADLGISLFVSEYSSSSDGT